MKQCIRYIILTITMLLFSIYGVIAQPVQFQVPIYLEGVYPATDNDTVWIGVSGDGPGGAILDNTYACDYDAAYGEYGHWREYLAPPPPPSFNWWVTLKDIPGRTEIGATGIFPYDFRGYNGPYQIDTFAIQVKGVDVGDGPLTISWPSNLTDYAPVWELRKKIGPNWIYTADMTASTSYTDPNAMYSTQLDYLVIRIIPPPLPPTFTPNVTSLDFGYVAVGGSSTQSVLVTNEGPGILTVDGAIPPTGYSVTPPSPGSFPVTILPEVSKEFSITFTPTSIGTIAGDVVFTHNASGGTTNISVTGIAYDPSLITPLLLTSSWNLVSVPRVQLDYNASVVFPGKNGNMYSYNTSTGIYDAAPTLINGIGYWVNYTGTNTVIINGSAPGSLSATAAHAGWVLVGSREIPVDVSSLVLDNGAVINGNAYRYNPVSLTYESTPTIEPGDGVWINVSAACTITIP